MGEKTIRLTVKRRGDILRIENIYRRSSVAVLDEMGPKTYLLKLWKKGSYNDIEINMCEYPSTAYIRVRHGSLSQRWFNTERLWIPSSELKSAQDFINSLRSHITKYDTCDEGLWDKRKW
jgi:hypothetical protein